MKKLILGAVSLMFGGTAAFTHGNSLPEDARSSKSGKTEAPLTLALPVPEMVPTTTVTVVPSTTTTSLNDPRPPARSTRSTRRRNPRVRKTPVTSRPGWDVVKNHIAACESGGRYNARNRRSTASGKYQFLDSTWAGRYGLKRAVQATPEQQEQAARELYDARGTQPWNASRHCWKRRVK